MPGEQEVFIRKLMNGALLVLICTFVLQPCVQAQQGNGRGQEQQEESAEVEQETRIDRREASDIARRAYGGRVVSIRLEQGEWRVRIDDEGTVFDVYVNASTGRTRRP